MSLPLLRAPGKARSEWMRDVILRELAGVLANDAFAGGDSRRSPAAGQCSPAARRGTEAYTRSIRQTARRDRHGQTRAGRKTRVRSEGGNAMAKTTWGRKETIIWPRHMPDLHLRRGLRCRRPDLLFLVCIRIHVATPLQRYYLPVYERTSVIRSVHAGPTGAATGCSSSAARQHSAACHERRCGAGTDAGARMANHPSGALRRRAPARILRCSSVVPNAAMWMRGCSDYLEGCRLSAEQRSSAFFRPPHPRRRGAVPHPAAVCRHEGCAAAETVEVRAAAERARRC